MSEPKNKTEEGKLEIIINAAQKRFAHYGLCKTTMNEIAADVGMGKASLYYYFPDKETLFASVIKKEQQVFFDEMNKFLNSDMEATLQLKKYVKLRSQHFRHLLNLSKLRSDFFNNVKTVYTKAFENFNNMEQEMVANIIQHGIATKEFKRINKHEYAEFLVHLLLGVRMVKLKYKDINEFGEADYEELDKKMCKVAGMFLKEIQAEQ
ncbi:TetR/AcrR family transcriptional regulator [Cytophaga aurantiaca]|uniref:TetR/AcrR family transcriptional regulator n=1 Tax=Cytophaga aurantiaca TaxID=29530 RepID=UPI00036B38AC|nr:TetR/AcrR family transcriptional regulator [Cytophaga aurantiaca]